MGHDEIRRRVRVGPDDVAVKGRDLIDGTVPSAWPMKLH